MICPSADERSQLPPLIRELTDREQLRELIFAYCRSMDRLDVDLMRRCYHPDASEDHGAFRGPANEFMPWAIELLRGYARTLHQIHNININYVGSELAFTESYATILHVPLADSAKMVEFYAVRYVDRIECRDGSQWRFAQRRLVWEWSTLLPANDFMRADEREGFLIGARDNSDASYWPGVVSAK